MILNRISKQVLHSIPVLSIFVLLGIITYSTIGIGFGNSIGGLISLGLSNVDGNAYAETLNNNTSLIIDNGTAISSTTTVRNGVAYSSHTVQVKADNITAYSLTINGPVGLTGNTTITGANNKTPANMANNTWGYAFAPNTANNESTLSYQSFTGSNQTLNSSNPSVSNNSVDFTRKLVFAAKFSQDAAEGHYRANVKLNLTVTPKTLTGDYSITYNLNGGSGNLNNMSINTNDNNYIYTIPGIVPTKTGYRFFGWSGNNSATIHYYPEDVITLTTTNQHITLSAVWLRAATTWNDLVLMQDMTLDICKSAAIGDSKILTDFRDGKTYTIRKLKDGNCWMVDNLKLDLSAVSLSSLSSNIDSFYLDIDTKSQFSADGKGSSDYKAIYGYYYTWCAATANNKDVCSSIAYGNAKGDICSLGWQLPVGNSSFSKGDFGILSNKYSAWTAVDGVNGRWLGASTASAGGAFFPAAGGTVYASSTTVSNVGSRGQYWTRTMDRQSFPYSLYFTNELAMNYSNGETSLYYPVRCIAYSS